MSDQATRTHPARVAILTIYYDDEGENTVDVYASASNAAATLLRSGFTPSPLTANVWHKDGDGLGSTAYIEDREVL